VWRSNFVSFAFETKVNEHTCIDIWQPKAGLNNHSLVEKYNKLNTKTKYE